MANPRALDKRRKSVRNIRKITRTMELIATARYKQAMDRAAAATAYTDRITQIVKDLTSSSLDFTHPLLEQHASHDNATLLVLTSNRGLCGGYNGGLCRATFPHVIDLKKEYGNLRLEIAGKKGIGLFRSQRKLEADETFTHFEDKPRYEEVEVIANRYLQEYVSGKLDRLDVSYTKFISSSKQIPVIETLLPLSSLEGAGEEEATGESMYEFMPSAESILEEVVPTSFKVKLFKCFLDAAVSEQIARMVAMKSATENASDLIKQLSREYNRARQGRITNEIMEIIGGVEALNN
ncbi:ATP synthase F1 subunit gamma [Blastopirellula retiformator]|uniref:ATP synthase gamma chain n=1 Tax=Blastopirellula retiformator TaxID=2527970 RepID=A0A5C5VPC0_9BACT|nr:ATP synthase F1 subunit gamma [Blastopirellula retiformator]TWT39775.1 ATP synthase gamma chain [Blastopirellula retiformator]